MSNTPRAYAEQGMANAMPPAADTIDVRAWLMRMIRLWPWFAASVAVCLTVAWLYLRYAEPVYQANASIMVKDDKKGGGSVLDNPMLKELGIGGQSKLVENEVEVLRSIDLMEQVVRRQGLFLQIRNKGRVADRVVFVRDFPYLFEFENPDTIATIATWALSLENRRPSLQTREKGPEILLNPGTWYREGGLRFRIIPNPFFKPQYWAGIDSKPDYDLVLNPVDATAAAYSKVLEVKPVTKMASVLTLSLKDKHPQKAEAALNALISLYNEQGLEDKNQVTANTIDFLNDRLQVVEAELKGVENQVASFKRSNRITNVSGEAEAFLDLAKTIDRQKAEQQTKLNLVEGLERELTANADNPKLVPSTFGIADPSLASLIERHNQLLLQRERLTERAGPKNPALLDLEQQVAELRNSLLSNVRSLKNAYSIALSDVSRQDRLLNSRISTIPTLERDLVQISRDRNVKEQLYLFLLEKREESAVTLAGTVADSRTIAKPRSGSAVSPKRSMTYGVALALGFLLPLLVVAALDFIDDKVGNREEVETRTQAPLLGEISHVKGLDYPIVINETSRSVVAEQFRGIRTGISFTGGGAEPRSILITSHRPGEGKSFTSLNLAASYALLNKKVVILEFDLRKPRLMRNLGLKADQGISTYLSRPTNLDELLVEVKGYKGKFWVLPTGPIPPNPAELILGPRMPLLMQALLERFDQVIIDSPPFSLVTDATLLQKYSEISIVVLRQGYSFRNAYKDINNRIGLFENAKQYIVLNGVNRNDRYSYYGAKYGYSYSDDYV